MVLSTAVAPTKCQGVPAGCISSLMRENYSPVSDGHLTFKPQPHASARPPPSSACIILSLVSVHIGWRAQFGWRRLELQPHHTSNAHTFLTLTLPLSRRLLTVFLESGDVKICSEMWGVGLKKIGGGAREFSSVMPHWLPLLADVSGHRERLTGEELPSVQCDMTLSFRPPVWCVVPSWFMKSGPWEAFSCGSIERIQFIIFLDFLAPFDPSLTSTGMYWGCKHSFIASCTTLSHKA